MNSSLTYHISVVRLQRTVYHGNVSIADAGFHHRVAGYAGIECCLGILYQVAVEVETVVQIILGRTRKTGFYAGSKLQLQSAVELTSQKFYLRHIRRIVSSNPYLTHTA